MLIRKTPTRVYFEGYEEKLKDLKTLLTYKNRAAEFEYRRFKKARWYLNAHGEEAYNEKLAELKDSITVCLLHEDETGIWTYAGLSEMLSRHFRDEVKNEVKYPEPDLIPWENPPKYESRYYQKESVEKLIEAKHAGVSLATGLGKTAIEVFLTKHFGLKTIIITPTISIARQTYNSLRQYFGDKRVGLFGDGKKQSDKLIVVGIGASLMRVQKGSKEWKNLSNSKVLLGDEAHTLPAETLTEVCFGLLAKVSYRFFLSATHTRSDGSDLLLKGITGELVYEMDVRQGVDEGFLSKPNFIVMETLSPSTYVSDDYQKMVEKHCYENAKLAKQVADIANKSVELLDHQVLILIDKIHQFQPLLPYLKHEVAFAHGGVTKDNKKYVDSRFHKSDTEDILKRFNDGEISIVVATGVFGMGTDFTSTKLKTVINLQFGQSEVKTIQGVGRGTRRPIGGDKTEFNFIDFYIKIPNYDEDTIIQRHARERISIYNELYGPVNFIDG